MRAPLLAITMGDPAGIGPEIIVKACRRLRDRVTKGELKLTVFGSVSALHQAARMLGETEMIPSADPVGAWPAISAIEVGPDQSPIVPGKLTAEGGRIAYLAVARAVEHALAGRVDGLVTAPLNKEALNLAGHHYAGHTDMLADLTKSRDSVMMLAHGDMRVSHVSTHIALEDVPRRVTKERVRRVIDLTHAALLELGIKSPRIAIAALNPHSGEGGIFGRQDIDVTAPVVQTCVTEGLDVVGPVPGDTIFVKLRARQYDAVVAMYHDQGHIPVKLLGFTVDATTGKWSALSGVNVTLGLPIIRTSVDHGTAFDIAGKGIANEDSLIEAIDYAVKLAAARN